MGYVKGTRLGKPGGFGEVFACKQKNQAGEVVRDDLAIKYLRLEHCDNQDMRDRFRAEVRYQRKLDHENVVSVVASNLSADRPWLVMLRGDCTLSERLKEGRANDREWAFDVFASIVRGVAHAHDREVLHRDLKPDNILFFGQVPKVADFGLGKHLQSVVDRTHTGTRLGSLAYMAPEQWGHAKHARKPADVYSLGKMLWEFVVGEAPKPFSPDLNAIDDERLREFVARCCEDEPAARFPDAGAALEVFEALRTELAPGAAPRERLKQLLDLWWLTPEGEDLGVLRKIDRLLDRNKDDEEFYYSGIPVVPDQILDHYITALPGEFAEMIGRYDEHVGSSVPFDYCDEMARIYLRAADLHPDRTVRERLFARVLKLGASNNRYAVADQLRRFLWAIPNGTRAKEVARVLRREPSTAWYDHAFLYRKPLADPIRAAFKDLSALEPEAEDDYSAGDLVEHAVFGPGEVLADEGGGIVMIAFEDGTDRRLMWAYAPLRKL